MFSRNAIIIKQNLEGFVVVKFHIFIVTMKKRSLACEEFVSTELKMFKLSYMSSLSS